ncbi:hypothetical protein ACVMFB_005730 [Bradyrhizobium sp. USDA 4522]
MKVAVIGVPHLVAFERRLAPRQREAKRDHDQHAPERGLERIDPARAAHPEADAAPHGAGQAVTPRAIDRELAKQIEEGDQRQRGERLEMLRLDADQEVAEIDRHQDRERDQEADQELLAAAGIFRRVAIDLAVRPQMTADVGGEPEPVEADRDQFEPGAARNQAEEFLPVP